MSKNVKNDWAGIFPYLPTPLTEAGALDVRGLSSVTERCIVGGVHGITPLGSSGELPYLDRRTRRRVIETVVDVAAGRVPVVSGVGGFDTKQIVEDAKAAEGAGSDGILLIPLAYFPLKDADILRLVEAVRRDVDLPLVLYNHPHVTHVDLSQHVVSTAYSDFDVRYVKDASGRIDRVRPWIDATGGGLRLFAGTALSPTAALLLGAVGWMAGPAALLPSQCVNLYELASAGKWRDAVRAEHSLQGYLEVFRRLGPGRGMKVLFAAADMPIGDPISPLAPIDEAEVRDARLLVQTTDERREP